MSTSIERVTVQEQFVEEERGISSGRLAAYLELTKPRITFLVVLTAVAGYCIGQSSRVDYVGLINLVIGVTLLSAGASVLNQYLERGLDGLMLRTKDRPLPANRLAAREALVLGLALSMVASAYMALLINPLTAALGIATIVSYLFIYTPLKTRTSLSTALGALPGAAPPLIGWTAARGSVTVEAWVLFAILFLWQFPHFLAIAWMYREDYARAGIKMLPVVDPEGRVTGQQIVSYTLMLIPVSLMPPMLGIGGTVYTAGAILLGLGFLWFGVRAAKLKTKWQARRLLLASVLYLPAVFGLMVLNR
ncbi:MAG TPA: heme o synthase [Blastocatellia bacterium]|nr:heme o synthase [Blastocatellia bacterium]